jgi:hypothetical protein
MAAPSHPQSQPIGGTDKARALTGAELATIRAALRLWVETPAAAIPDICFAELDTDAGCSDDDVERLLGDLAHVEAVRLERM